MKKLFLAVVVLLMVSAAGYAQNEKKHFSARIQKDNWEEIKAEKIGFITEKLSLSVSEAQAFWPVYNEYEKASGSANAAVRKAMKKLRPKEDENVSESEMRTRLNTYVEAKQKVSEIMAEYNKEFIKVLPAEKVAKLYLAEEQFMHNMLERFAQKRNQPKPPREPKPVTQK